MNASIIIFRTVRGAVAVSCGAALLIGSLAVGAQAYSPEPPRTPGDTSPVTPDPFGAFARQLDTAIHQLGYGVSGGAHPYTGYLLLKTNRGTSSGDFIDLYWKGEVNPEIATVIAANPAFRVVVHPVDFTEAQFLAAQTMVSEAVIAWLPKGVRYVGTFHATGRAGLIVELAGAVSDADAGAVQASLQRTVIVPVVVRANSGVSFAPAPALKPKVTLKTTTTGRTLRVAVKVSTKTSEPPSGSKLLTVRAKAVTLKAKLNAKGVAKVKLPKSLKRGGKVVVKFAGTANLAAAKKVIRF